MQTAISLACLLLLPGAPAPGPASPGQPSPGPTPPELAFPGSPPAVPLGLDAYRAWDRWPLLRIGVRARMRSTYDRTGGNEAADASHFLYQEAEDRNIVLDLEGPGVLEFARFNHWHGSPWRIEVDGEERVVSETSTADPDHPVPGSVFLPREAFPRPLAFTWSETKGADLLWTPIPFERSLRIGYSRTHYGTGYFIFHLAPPGAPLERPIRAWSAKPPARDVIRLLSRPAEELVPEGPRVTASSRTVDLLPGRSETLLETGDGPAAIRSLTLTVPATLAVALGRARLRITWDGRPQPSVDAPVDLFHGAGTAYNRTGREWLVRAFPVSIRFAGGQARFTAVFPMPYRRSARIEIEGGPDPVRGVAFEARREPCRLPAAWLGYFHATYRDHGTPPRGRDLVLLDTAETEGGGDWGGHLVGTSWVFSERGVLSTLEGDPRFFFDGSGTPQAQGTGTEEWGGGGDYWGGENMTLPFAGHPVGARKPSEAKDPLDLVESAYRFLLADLMPFGRRARICLEHGGTNESAERYRTVTYWYGIEKPFLVPTDVLDVGDPESEERHGYRSPGASPPEELTSRYEWGVDHVDGEETYPALTDRGRTTRGTTEMTLRIDPGNLGVLLRRRLDYAVPDQRAEVAVAGVEPEAAFEPAGTWYLAGSTTCVYSNPREETGKARHDLRVSDHRFRDDEFLLPPRLIRGRSAIRVRLTCRPVDRPLFPGGDPRRSGWSEFRYEAYSFVLPRIP